jgi:hypothetical protein
MGLVAKIELAIGGIDDAYIYITTRAPFGSHDQKRRCHFRLAQTDTLLAFA